MTKATMDMTACRHDRSIDDWDWWAAGLLASVVGNRHFTQDAIYDRLLEVSPESRRLFTSFFPDVFEDLIKSR